MPVAPDRVLPVWANVRVPDDPLGTTRAPPGHAFYARNDYVGAVMTSRTISTALCALALVSGTEARQRL
jgi:hypothetical protein